MNRRWVTAALLLVMALAAMELNVTSTAMPTIIGDLHGLEHYSWVTSVYLLMCTVTVPLYGRLADALGRKKVVLAAIAIFAGASMLAAASQTLWQLILFRGLQGLGAGGIMPVVLTILGDIFTLRERARVQGWFSAVWGCSALAGPAVGALLVETLGWRSIFFINLPFGVLGFVVLAARYHDHEQPHSTVLDLPGTAVLAIACTAILGLVSGIGPGGWSWTVNTVLVVAALAAMALLVRIERRASNPIMPPELFSNREIGPAFIASALLGVAFFGVETFVPLYVQGTTGAGATAAAGVITPIMLSWAVSGIAVAPLVVRWGFRRTAIVGCIAILISLSALLVCALVHAGGWTLAAVLMLSGIGFGASSMSYLLGVQHSVTWQQRGIATSSMQFFRTMGGAVGIGLLGMLFNVLAAPQMQRLRDIGVNPATVMDPHTRDQLSPEAVQITYTMIDHGLTWVFAAMLVCAVLQLLATWAMTNADTGESVTEAEAIDALPA